MTYPKKNSVCGHEAKQGSLPQNVTNTHTHKILLQQLCSPMRIIFSIDTSLLFLLFLPSFLLHNFVASVHIADFTIERRRLVTSVNHSLWLAYYIIIIIIIGMRPFLVYIHKRASSSLHDLIGIEIVCVHRNCVVLTTTKRRQ